MGVGVELGGKPYIFVFTRFWGLQKYFGLQNCCEFHLKICWRTFVVVLGSSLVRPGSLRGSSPFVRGSFAVCRQRSGSFPGFFRFVPVRARSLPLCFAPKAAVRPRSLPFAPVRRTNQAETLQ